MKSGCESQKQLKKRRSIELPVLKQSAEQEKNIRQSKTSRWRAFALITLNLLMIVHIIQWLIMGRTISPIEPSETMYTLQNGAINAGFIFFTLAILATLIFGRFVCGWGCHVLALQDFCGWLLKKIGLKPKPFRSRLLVFVPLLVALYMFVFPTVYKYFAKAPNEPLIPQFTNHLVTTDFWATFPPVYVAIPFLFICGFMTVYFLGQKGFCTYACPYGGFFSLADKVAPGKIRVTDACNQCGHCTAVCTSNVLVHAEVKEYGMVVDQGCMKCMDCVSVCPNDALYFGFGKPAIGVKQTIKKNFSLTWGEEIAAAIIFLASLFAVWNVYQLVPMLMALGIATVSTFLAVRIIKLFRNSDSAFYRYNLKSSGKINKAGWIFLIFATVWIGLNVHSGWVHYYEYKGLSAFENRLNQFVNESIAIAQKNPEQLLNSAQQEEIINGRNYLRTAKSIGLFTNSEVSAKLAWLEFLSGNADQAVSLFAVSADYQKNGSKEKAMSLYNRGAILNRLGRFEEAIPSLNQSLAERPDLSLALEEKGESLWQLGRKDEAVIAWTTALRQNPALPNTSNFLAGAAASRGQIQTAEAWEKHAARFTPADAAFEWMLGLRLKNIGMSQLAEKHFERAIQLNPAFKTRQN